MHRVFAAILGLFGALAPAATAQTRHLTYELDVRPPLDGGAPLGVDFDLRLDVERNDASSRGHALDGSAFAKGFRALGDAAGDLDHITLGVDLGGRYSTGGQTQLEARQAEYFRLLTNLDPAGGGPGLTPSQEADLNRFTTLRRSYYGYKLVYQYETTEDFARGQHALGAQVVGELPLLHELLDVVPSALRLEEGFAPQRVRLAVGFDYVTGVDSTFAGAADHEAEVGRLRYEAAWSTRAFEGLPVGISWQAHHVVAGPSSIDAAGRSFNSFIEAWAFLPLSSLGRSGIELTYLNGRLPPDYTRAEGAELGFSFAVY